MTEADQRWLKSEFDRIHGAFEDHRGQCDKRFCGAETWIGNVEKKTDANSKFIWMLIGGLTLIGVILGMFQYAIK